MTPRIKALDHLVLTVADIAVTVDFYTHVLGMQAESFTPAGGAPRMALRFGSQKINLHRTGAEFRPHAGNVQAGSADLCFLSDTPLADWQAHLSAKAVQIEEGPLRRTGAEGPLMSIYLRDPDGNLIEISNRLPASCYLPHGVT
ncbi:VOC family protein [Seohaeicola saemankumensis]|uniref:VOC family protein n=1 Tax=Seohaeicola saemankumensis TaxID=481181 RepID=UPI001E3FC805|nr:VOC family protein [Seohaeicola saemankumensis]MCD1626621.1 VOC family protein [Seohaeicola saemankumensis]